MHLQSNYVDFNTVWTVYSILKIHCVCFFSRWIRWLDRDCELSLPPIQRFLALTMGDRIDKYISILTGVMYSSHVGTPLVLRKVRSSFRPCMWCEYRMTHDVAKNIPTKTYYPVTLQCVGTFASAHLYC